MPDNSGYKHVDARYRRHMDREWAAEQLRGFAEKIEHLGQFEDDSLIVQIAAERIGGPTAGTWPTICSRWTPS
jgi:hypothetical protein